MTSGKPQRQFSPGEIASMITRRWMLVLICSVLAFGGASAYLVLKGPTFVATTKLLVLVGRERFSALQVSQVSRENVLFQERVQAIYNEIEILRDPSITVAIYDDLLAYQQELAAQDAAAAAAAPRTFGTRMRELMSGAASTLRSGIDAVKAPLYKVGVLIPVSEEVGRFETYRESFLVEFIKETDIINVGFASKDPRFAAYALRRYLEAYRARHVELMSSQQAMEFYDKQLEWARVQMAEAEEALRVFREGADVPSLDIEREIALDAISDIERERERLSIELEDMRLSRESIQRTYDSGVEWIETPARLERVGLAALEEAFVNLTSQRNRLLGQFSPESRDVRAVESELERLRTRKYESLISIIDEETVLLNARIDMLAERADERREKLARLTDSSTDLQLLTRELDSRRELVERYRQERERFRVNAELDTAAITSVKQISGVAEPTMVAGPRRMLVLAVAAALGLVLGIAAAVLLGLSDRRVRSSRDLTETAGLPVIETVPPLQIWTTSRK